MLAVFASSTKVSWHVFLPGQRNGLIGERVTLERPPRGRGTGCAELHVDSVARVGGVLSELRIGQRPWSWMALACPVAARLCARGCRAGLVVPSAREMTSRNLSGTLPARLQRSAGGNSAPHQLCRP